MTNCAIGKGEHICVYFGKRIEEFDIDEEEINMDYTFSVISGRRKIWFVLDQ